MGERSLNNLEAWHDPCIGRHYQRYSQDRSGLRDAGPRSVSLLTVTMASSAVTAAAMLVLFNAVCPIARPHPAREQADMSTNAFRPSASGASPADWAAVTALTVTLAAGGLSVIGDTAMALADQTGHSIAAVADCRPATCAAPSRALAGLTASAAQIGASASQARPLTEILPQAPASPGALPPAIADIASPTLAF